MSRHFELLQRVALDRELFGSIADQAVPIVAPDPAGSAPPHAPSDDDEAMRLVQRVFLAPDAEAAPRRTVFAAIEPDTSAGTIAARAAECLAALVPGPVCLVDADLRSPSIHRYFGIAPGRGLVDAVTGGRLGDCLKRVPGTNLSLVTAGSGSPPDGLLARSGTRAVLAELDLAFERVLLVASSVSLTDDAVLLGRQSYGVVLVIAAHATRRDLARRARERFDAAGVRLLGAVLTGRTFPIPDAIYRRL